MKKLLAPILILAFIILSGCVPANQAGSPTNADTSPKSNEAVELEAGVVSAGGEVISGGDTTPEGLLDGPRTFIYQVRLENGATIDVKYVALPPSPAGDQKKIELDFHAGQVQVGDYMEFRGTFDPDSKTLSVSEEGDFIRTYPEKP